MHGPVPQKAVLVDPRFGALFDLLGTCDEELVVPFAAQ